MIIISKFSCLHISEIIEKVNYATYMLDAMVWNKILSLILV